MFSSTSEFVLQATELVVEDHVESRCKSDAVLERNGTVYNRAERECESHHC